MFTTPKGKNADLMMIQATQIWGKGKNQKVVATQTVTSDEVSKREQLEEKATKLTVALEIKDPLVHSLNLAYPGKTVIDFIQQGLLPKNKVNFVTVECERIP